MSRFRMLIGLLLAAPILFVPMPAHAHTLKVDGQIGVTLHIDPDDEPIAMSMSTLSINIQDKSGVFKPAECTCTIDVLHNGAVIDSLQFSPDARGSATAMYAFPESGRYNVTIAGSTQSADKLARFTTTFTYQVKQGSDEFVDPQQVLQEQSWLRSYTPLVVIAAALFLLILFLWPMPKLPQKQRVKRR